MQELLESRKINSKYTSLHRLIRNISLKCLIKYIKNDYGKHLERITKKKRERKYRKETKMAK